MEMVNKLFIQPNLMGTQFFSPFELIYTFIARNFGKQAADPVTRAYIQDLMEFPVSDILHTELKVSHQGFELAVPSIAKLAQAKIKETLDYPPKVRSVATLYLSIWHNMALQPYSLVLISHQGRPLRVEQLLGYIEARHRLEVLITEDPSMVKSESRIKNDEWPCAQGIWHLIESSCETESPLNYFVWSGDECIKGTAHLEVAKKLVETLKVQAEGESDAQDFYILKNNGITVFIP